MEKDLIVIGGGPGGYIAAIRAAQLGAKVLLVEQEKVGGTCLHWGCIPTKALYRNAEVLNNFKKADEFGINVEGFSLDMAKVQSRKQEVVEKLHSGIDLLLKNAKVEVLKGIGTLIGPHSVEVTDSSGNKQQADSKYILLATGSYPSRIPILGADLPGVISSNEALSLDKVPKSMIIIGGGVIGIEFAGIFQSFGTQVTVLELLPRILPMMDEEIIKRMLPLLKKRGIKIETSMKVSEIAQGSEGLTVKAENKKGQPEAFDAELVLIATGRSVNTKGLSLDEIGVIHDKRGIHVNEHFSTSVPGIFAIGDVIGGQMLAHVASHQGIEVVESLFSNKNTDDHPSPLTTDLVRSASSGMDSSTANNATPVVPSCVFSFPELSAVGLTEEQLKEQGIPYIVSKFMFGANGKALTLGEGEGLVKVLAHKDDKRILGVHILGPHASDLIHEATLAIHKNLTANDITHMIHAHPTLAESFHDAILGL